LLLGLEPVLVGLRVGLELLIFAGGATGLLLGFFVGFLFAGFLLLGLEFAGFLLADAGLEFAGFLLLGSEPVLPLFLPHLGHDPFFLLFFALVRSVVLFLPNFIL
jgi:hypothetical protein